jgi:transposase
VCLTDNAKSGIECVCSDRWKPCLEVMAEQIPAAIHVLDRFHILRIVAATAPDPPLV